MGRETAAGQNAQRNILTLPKLQLLYKTNRNYDDLQHY